MSYLYKIFYLKTSLKRILFGLIFQAAGSTCYLVTIKILSTTLTSNFLSEFFIVYSIASTVAQLSTAGVDGKLYYLNSDLSKSIKVSFLQSGFVYIPISLFCAFIIFGARNIIFPFQLTWQASFFMLSTIFVQPLLSNVLSLATARMLFNISNIMMSGSWIIRAMMLYVYSLNSENNIIFTFDPLSFIYILYGLSLIFPLIIGALLLTAQTPISCSSLASLSNYILKTDISFIATKTDLVYGLSNLFAWLPLSLAPYMLYMRTGDSPSVASLGILLSLYSLASSFIAIFYTRTCLPALFVFVHKNEFHKLFRKILIASIPLALILVSTVLIFCLYRDSFLSNIFANHIDLPVNIFIIFFLILFFTIYFVPTQALLSGGASFLPWTCIRITTSIFSILVMYLFNPRLGIYASLASIALWLLMQTVGYFVIIQSLSGDIVTSK